MIKRSIFIASLLCFCLVSIAQSTDPTPYCSGDFSNTTDGVNAHAITSVGINPWGNVSGPAQQTSPHYVHFDNLAVPEFDAGEDYFIEIVTNNLPGAHGIAAWMDFDADGEFEADELIGFLANPTDANNGFDFTIPLLSPGGETRLRVRVYQDQAYVDAGLNTNPTPCGYMDAMMMEQLLQFGETEDYTVNIIAPDEILVDFVEIVSTSGNGDIYFVGGSLDLDVELDPVEATATTTLIWESDDETIATVDENGVVTATGLGDVEILVTVDDDNGEEDTFVISVLDVVLVESINVTSTGDITVLEGPAGSTVQMLAETVPADAFIQTFTWSISDESIATIDENGLVTSVSNGTVIITATSDDGAGGMGIFELEIFIPIPVEGLAIEGQDGNNTVEVAATLQMVANFTPADATYQGVNWSVDDETIATIDPTSGLLTGVALGDVMVTGVSEENNAFMSQFMVSVVPTLVVEISVAGENAAVQVDLNGAETLQMVATITPANATNQMVVWTASDETLASISAEGLLTGLVVGIVEVTATAQDGTMVAGSTMIEIVDTTPIPVESIVVVGEDDATEIIGYGNTLQMIATVLPENATDASVTWSVDNDAFATIDDAGLLTAVSEGMVEVTATAQDGSMVAGSTMIQISPVLIESITVQGEGGATMISGLNNTLQMEATTLPDNATLADVTWSVSTEGFASIDQNGLLTPLASGTVTVTATAQDASGISGSTEIEIDVTTLVVSIILTADGGATGIDTPAGTLQILTEILPTNATNQVLVWESNNIQLATVDQNGVVTANANGTVLISATATDGSKVSNFISLEITNQPDAVAEIVALDFELYPNPVTEKLFIVQDNIASGTVVLYDLAGKIVATQRFHQSGKLSVDISELSAGIYQLNIVDHNGQRAFTTKRMIKR